MTDQEAIVFFKCLADKSRLAILKSLMEEDMYVERLAERLGVTSATVSFHLKKLEEAGIRDRVKVMVGGSPVSRKFADEIGAEGYSSNAVEAVKVAKELVGVA